MPASPGPESSPLEVTDASAGGTAVQNSATLPDEIWYAILDLLGYRGLHKAAQLCKKLQSFVQAERFDAILFRQKPPKSLPGKSKVAIHPLLQATNCIFEGKNALTRADRTRRKTPIFSPHRTKWRTAFEYAAVDEFATSPACTTLNIDMNFWKNVTITDQDGVTVRRVLKRIGNFWASKAPRDLAEEAGFNLREEPDKISMRQCLGDDCAWVGWYKAIVETDGKAVMMRADGFDT